MQFQSGTLIVLFLVANNAWSKLTESGSSDVGKSGRTYSEYIDPTGGKVNCGSLVVVWDLSDEFLQKCMRAHNTFLSLLEPNEAKTLSEDWQTCEKPTAGGLEFFCKGREKVVKYNGKFYTRKKTVDSVLTQSEPKSDREFRLSPKHEGAE